MRHIGKYKLEEEIGRGQFGIVYRAFDPGLNEAVAVKILTANGDKEALRKEASMTRMLKHDNIVIVYECEIENGEPYMVMELLEGRTLRNVIDAHEPASLLDKIGILVQIASGMVHAHVKGIIHRDLKPGNIMVLSTGMVKIMDFGISQKDGQDLTRRTGPREFAGTIQYMAPEQIESSTITKAADIFAFGVICYELLSGANPFAAADPRTVVYRVTTVTPEPLSDFIPDFPLQLDALIQRLLHKDPDLRTETMAEALVDLKPIWQQLREARAEELAAGLPAALASGDPRSAQALVATILDLNSLHPRAREARRTLVAHIERENRRASFERFVAEARAHAAERRFQAAVTSFERALGLNPSEEVRLQLESAKASFEAARKALRIVAEARWESQKGNVESVLEKANQALVLDPGNKEAIELAESAQWQITRAKAAVSIKRSHELSAEGLFDAALEELREYDGSALPEVEAERQCVRSAAEEAARRLREAAFEAGVAATRKLLRESALEEAEKAAEELVREFAEKTDAGELLAEARELLALQRRRRAVEAAARTAQELHAENRYGEARTVLNEEFVRYPEASLKQLLELTDELENRWLWQKSLDSHVAYIEELRTLGYLRAAVDAADAALRAFGIEPVLLDLREKAADELEKKEYREALDHIIVESMMLMASNQPEEALQVLEGGKPRFESEPDLLRTLTLARAAVEEHRRQRALREAEVSVQHLETEGQWNAALSIAEKTAQELGSTPALTAAAERLREAIRVRERQETLARHREWIQGAIDSQAWDYAEKRIAIAKLALPDEASLDEFQTKVDQGRRQSTLERLEKRVQSALSQGSFPAAIEALASAEDWVESEETASRLWEQCNAKLLAEEHALDQRIAILAALRMPPARRRRLEIMLAGARQNQTDRWNRMEQEALAAALSRERADELPQAIETLEAALAQLIDRPRLAEESARLKLKLETQQKNAAHHAHVRAINAVMRQGEWNKAEDLVNGAGKEFPEAPDWKTFAEQIAQGRYAAGLQAFGEQLAAAFGQAALEEATEMLLENRSKFGTEQRWQEGWAKACDLFLESSRLGANAPIVSRIAQKFSKDAGLLQLRDSVLQAHAAQQERQALEEAKARIETAEKRGDLGPALEEAAAAHERFPDDQQLHETKERLERQLAAELRRQAIAQFVSEITDAISRADWDAATLASESAQREFAGEPKLSRFVTEIPALKRRADLLALESSALAHIEKNDLAGCAALLADRRGSFADEPVWRKLWSALERRVQQLVDTDSGALQSIKTLAERFPDEPEVQEMFRTARQNQEERRESLILGLLERAAKREANEDFARALAILGEIGESAASDPRVKETHQRLEQAQLEQERDRRNKEQISAIESSIGAKDWSLASAQLVEAEKVFPGDPALASLKTRIEAGRAALRDSLLQMIESSIYSDDWDGAAAKLAEAGRRMPGEAAFDGLEGLIVDGRNQSLRLEYLANLESAIKDKDWDRAQSILERASQDLPGEAGFESFPGRIGEGRRKTKLEACGAEVEEAIQAGEWERASQSLASGARDLGEDSTLAEFAERIESGRKDFLRKTHSKKIEAALEKNDWEAASQRLAEALRELPDDPAITAFGGRVERARLDSLRQKHRTQITSALERKDWKQAAKALSSARSDIPESRFLAPFEGKIERLRLDELRTQHRDVIHNAIERCDWKTASTSLSELPKEIAGDAIFADLRKRQGEGQKNQIRVQSLRELEAAIEGSDWDLASERLGEAARELPGDVAFQGFEVRIESGRTESVRHTLLQAIQVSIQARNWEEAEEKLTAAKEGSADPAFEVLGETLDREKKTDLRKRYAQELEDTLQRNDWAGASAALENGLRELPGETSFDAFPARIQEVRKQAELGLLETAVREALAKDEFDRVIHLLASTRELYSKQRVWQDLRKELDRLKSYKAGLDQATAAIKNKEFDRARDILKWLVQAAPDTRAQDMLKSLQASGRKTRRL